MAVVEKKQNKTKQKQNPVIEEIAVFSEASANVVYSGVWWCP